MFKKSDWWKDNDGWNINGAFQDIQDVVVSLDPMMDNTMTEYCRVRGIRQKPQIQAQIDPTSMGTIMPSTPNRYVVSSQNLCPNYSDIVQICPKLNITTSFFPVAFNFRSLDKVNPASTPKSTVPTNPYTKSPASNKPEPTGNNVGAPTLAYGHSEEWVKSKTDAITLFNLFTHNKNAFDPARAKKQAIKESKQWINKAYEDIDGAIFISYIIYEYFTSYLTNIYIIAEGCRNAGQKLASGTVLMRLAQILNRAKLDHCGSNDKRLLFFRCLDVKSNATSAIWYKGLKQSVCCYLS